MLRAVFALLFALPCAASAQAPPASARQRWAEGAYGPMLERILPPRFEPGMLPAPRSRGARLALRYCVQCHNLPNPAMHTAARWPPIVARMVARMRGQGNMGRLMTDLMAGVEAPDASEERLLVAYFQKYGQKPLDERSYPELKSRAGESFRLACSQCHTLPDPKRHTAAEWPKVVARMQRNMQWMNRVVGSGASQGEPQLRVDEINAFLQKYARRE